MPKWCPEWVVLVLVMMVSEMYIVAMLSDVGLWMCKANTARALMKNQITLLVKSTLSLRKLKGQHHYNRQ